MDALMFILTFLVYLLIVVPICTALHEAGHASMILLLTKQKVTFQFGARGSKWELHWRRLAVDVHFVDLLGLGFCRYHLEDKARLSPRQDLWITLAGPLASLFVALVCGILYWTSNGADPWMGFTAINLAIFLNASIPWVYPQWQGVQAGVPSDGRQVMDLIQRLKSIAPG